MGTLYLVRHGQASFGAADYDRLSALGQRQCAQLGRWWHAHGQRFGLVLHGTLRRQRESFEAIASGMPGLPAAQVWPGLNEYDGDALARAVHTGDALPPTTPEGYRQHFRWLREGLMQWMAGTVQPTGMPTWADFVAGVGSALAHVREHPSDDALIVSSGGPIATAVAQVLGAPPQTVIELNMRIRNSAITEIHLSPRRQALVMFNAVPHLAQPEHAGWITMT